MAEKKSKVPLVTFQPDGNSQREFKGTVGAVKIKESGSHAKSKTLVMPPAQKAQKGPMARRGK